MSQPRLKRSRIDEIKEETELELVRRGANLSSDTRDDLQFVCNYMLSKSYLSKALRSLNVLSGRSLVKCYRRMPGVSFYKFAMWAHYLQTLAPARMLDLDELFRSASIRPTYERVKTLYYDLRQDLRQKRVQSMNTEGAENDDMKARLREMLTCGLDRESFADRYSFTGWRGLYVIARMFRGEFEAEDLREYVDENLDEIVTDFVENGYTRSLLSHFHNVQLPSRREAARVRGTLEANDNVIVAVLGISHDELNHLATEYQDSIWRKMHLMANWEYLDDPKPYFNLEGNTEDMLTDIESTPVLTSGSLTEDVVPKQVMGLARKLSRKHGPVKIANESSGLHIYLADPELLRKDGKKELKSLHLAINADKFFGLNQWDIDLHPTDTNKALYRKYRMHEKEIPCATSMKTGKVYLVSDLLQYAPLAKRSGLFANVAPDVTVGAIRKNLVCDENGNLVPEWVGHTIPLTQLDKNHPAVEYLESRGYDLNSLERQFEACYCDEALPESRGEGRFYSRLPGGMRNSPQGRIIFTVRMNGVRQGYQSRYIDKWSGDLHYFWSHEQKWMLIHERLPDGTLREVYPPDERFKKGFDPHKYMNATGSERNKLLMGYDAAVLFNSNRPKNKRYCVLVEGPLDAARIGPPALALLGKSLSQFQAEAIRKEFTHILTVMDNDAAGRQGLARIHSMLEHNPIADIQLPTNRKDIGEMTYEEARDLLAPYIPQ